MLFRNFINLISKLSSAFVCSNGKGAIVDTENSASSSGGSGDVWQMILVQIGSLVDNILDLLFSLCYKLVSFILQLIDFIYILFKQLAGLNASKELANYNNLENTDLIFQFIKGDTFITIMKQLLVFALVLLLVFAIIAVVKAEYDTAVTGEVGKKKQVLVSSLRALFLMLIVPIIAIGSIVLSNVVLSSISSVFKNGADISISSQAFISASVQANHYRRYAESGYVVPITMHFDKVDVDDIQNVPISGSVSEIEKAYQEMSQLEAWEIGYLTYLTFANKTFLPRQSIPDTYYNFYDSEELLYSSSVNAYHVMADLQDDLLTLDLPFYFVRASEVDLNSFSVQYINQTLTYIDNVEKGQDISEENGAKFVVCYRPTFVDSEGVVSLGDLTPFVSGKNGNLYYSNAKNNVNKIFYFNSDFLANGEFPILAKGIFSEEGYPTAIRCSKNGDVVCYRDKVNIPMLGDIFPLITYESNPSYSESATVSVLKKGMEFITGVNIDNLVPHVYFRFDLKNLYQVKEFISANSQADNPFRINYMFSGSTGLSNHYMKFDWSNCINWLALALIATFLIKYLFNSCIGFIARAFEIVILFFLYPVVVSMMPIDNGEKLKNWNGQFVGKLFSAYGVVITLNFIFIMIPIISDMSFFEHGDFASFSGSFSFASAYVANLIFQCMLMLVLFTFVKTGMSTISDLIASSNDSDAYSMGEKALSDVSNVAQKMTNVLSGKFVTDLFHTEKGTDSVGKFLLQKVVPGGMIINRVLEDVKFAKSSKATNALQKLLKNSLINGNEDDIQDLAADLSEHNVQRRSMTKRDIDQMKGKKPKRKSRYNKSD